MTAYVKEPDGVALSLIENEKLAAVFDAMECDAIERCLSAKTSDHQTRLYAIMEVEAIRSVRGRLAVMAAGEMKPHRPEPAA
jgi:hypothetical protein